MVSATVVPTILQVLLVDFFATWVLRRVPQALQQGLIGPGISPLIVEYVPRWSQF
jgi:hypothetical protein